MKKCFIKIPTLFAIILFTLTLSFAANKGNDLSSPNGAVYNHLFYLQKDTYDAKQSARSLDFRLRDKQIIDRAIQLKQIYDGKGLYVSMSKIPDDPNYFDSISKKYVFFPFPKELPMVYLEKKGKKWQYAEETIGAIPGLHSKTYPFGTDVLINLVQHQSGKKFLGVYLWQYLGILIFFAASAMLYLLLRLVSGFLIRRISRISLHFDVTDKKLIRRTSHIFSLMILMVFARFFIPVFQFSVKTNMFLQRFLELVIIVFVTIFLMRIVDFLIKYFRNYAEKTENKLDDQLVPIVSQIIRLFILIGAFFQILSLFNVNVTALIAGVSIGGLAIALAAKEAVGNLIGSLMIFLDKPFHIGDFVKIDSVEGVVKEVGFRSTRVMTKDTSIVSIPNGILINSNLVNMGIREFRLHETTFSITYDTPPALIEAYLEGLKRIVKEHPVVSNDNCFIYLSEIGPNSIDILFRVHIDTKNFDEELAIKEKLILMAMKLAEALEIRFAFPSTTVYIEQFPGQQSLTPVLDRSKEAAWKKLDDYFGSKDDALK
ncbi:MAG TPA: mechanosensitive ion channel family protein [Saprospirales bacterium]|nr:mechanosensitive ion channel family protein [Saprospirales bacterium]HRQ28527.1 mechanosensitive ion channel family protein [Saprospiraceae bacterium]